jgi:hypothetical protein
MIAGIVGLLVSRFIPSYYKTAAQALSVALFVVGVFMVGAITDNEAWLARVREMEGKIKEVEVQVVKENVRVETKYVDRVQIVKQKGEEIVRYVDREIVKYDDSCKLPDEFIVILNKAAEPPK